MFPISIPNFKLNFWYRDDLFEGKASGIPKINRQIVGRSGNQILMLQKLQIQDLTLMRIDLVQQRSSIGIVDLKTRTVLLQHKQILQPLKIIEVLNTRLVLLPVHDLIANEVTLYHVLKTTVVTQQTQLDYVITKLFPLHSLVPIHVHLLEKINQSQRQLHLQLIVTAVVIQMLQHHRHEIVNRQTLILITRTLKTLLYHRHLLTMQHLQNLSLSYLVTLPPLLRPTHSI